MRLLALLLIGVEITVLVHLVITMAAHPVPVSKMDGNEFSERCEKELLIVSPRKLANEGVRTYGNEVGTDGSIIIEATKGYLRLDRINDRWNWQYRLY